MGVFSVKCESAPESAPRLVPRHSRSRASNSVGLPIARSHGRVGQSFPAAIKRVSRRAEGADAAPKPRGHGTLARSVADGTLQPPRLLPHPLWLPIKQSGEGPRSFWPQRAIASNDGYCPA
jgi:hypothetical protein